VWGRWWRSHNSGAYTTGMNALQREGLSADVIMANDRARSSNSIESSGESEKVWALLKRLIFNKLFTFDVGLLRQSLDEMKS